MQPILVAALGFIGVFVTLTGLLVGQRTLLVMRGLRSANSFSPDGSDGSPLAARVVRAHANCAENLGAFALIVLVAHASGSLPVLNPLAYVFVGARVVQSTVHVISTSNPAVIFRATAFLVQVIVQVIWVTRILSAG